MAIKIFLTVILTLVDAYYYKISENPWPEIIYHDIDYFSELMFPTYFCESNCSLD